MNETITCCVLEAAIKCGVMDFVVCPAGRCAPFVDVLRCETRVSTYYWPEERSAAFFALGLSRRKQRPAAVIVTSGTAAGELLPAAMEAYYSGVPLMLITADRPRRFRGSGAPQTAEQVGLFGIYAQLCLDIEKDNQCDLSGWAQQMPVHLNVCLEEPQGQDPYSGKPLNIQVVQPPEKSYDEHLAAQIIDGFLESVKKPLVIVSTLPFTAKEPTVDFLLTLNAPVYLEGVSGLREDPNLQNLRIRNTEKILESARSGNYPVDGILRIGGVPTNRVWRDVENLNGQIKVCSLTERPFSGLSWNKKVAYADIGKFLKTYKPKIAFDSKQAEDWINNDHDFFWRLQELFHEEPLAEPSLIYALANLLPVNGHLYLGNSLPIREWDLAAVLEDRGLEITASRGLNGIDGQIATFLGLCQPDKDNWAILGDLTALYDMAGFWGLPSLEASNISVVIINNGGGKIFERIFPHPEMLNCHGLSFEPLAKMWELPYQCWRNGVQSLTQAKRQVIEIIPCEKSTKRFWNKINDIKLKQLCNNVQLRTVPA